MPVPLTCRTADGRRRDQRGVAALEFALVVPLLAGLLLATVTFGVAYSRSIGLANAVREGARFGATADAASASWAADVVARVRATQFDDAEGSASSTSVCVQLVKFPSTVTKELCDPGNGSVTPTLTMPATSATPAVPTASSGFGTGQCVVRIYAARAFTVNAALTTYDGILYRGSVTRYERSTC